MYIKAEHGFKPTGLGTCGQVPVCRAPNESRFLAGTRGFIRGNTHGFGSPVCRYPALKKPAGYGCQMWELTGDPWNPSQIYVDHVFAQLLHKVARSHSRPAGSQTREAAHLRPVSLQEDKTFSQKCESIFLVIWGSNISLSCTGSVVPGRARLHSNLSTHVRLKLRILGIPHISMICIFVLDLCSYLSRFSGVFYVDASTKETISAGLINIAQAKGIGDSEEATLDWLSSQREEWLLVLDNADDPNLNLRPYLPSCAHGNILITSRNRDTCFYTTQSCQVSDMRLEDARELLFKTACLEHTKDTEALATTIVKVHLLCLSSRSMR